MKTVLVIDDDTFVRESIVDLLEIEGFCALGAESGARGLKLATENRPDVILCDVQMPDIDGYEVLTSLRQNRLTNSIPFIFLTARVAKTDQRYGMNLGADDYLTKPCSTEELLEAINSRLAKQSIAQCQMHQELESLRSSITLALPHELRTPLTGILTSVELLRLLADSPTPADLLEIADTIQNSSQKLYRLIQNYLLYAKLEVAARDPILLEGLQATETYQPDVIVKNTAFQIAERYDRETDLQLRLQGVPVTCASSDLEKVVSELVDNAFKFSTDGSPVQIETHSDGMHYCINITDQGRGMSADQIGLLGAYMQFDRRIYEQHGIGLGFAIAKRLVELCGGRLSLSSLPNCYTTVSVVLPCVELSEPFSEIEVIRE